MKLLKISLILGLGFIMSSQPMFMIGVLMMLVILYSLMIYYEIGSFWMGYVLMLVLLSGVLVIFTYIVSLAPNESFEFFSLFMFILIFMIVFFENYFLNLGGDESFICTLLWEGVSLIFVVYLMLLLLSVMVMVIFVSQPQFGALRLYLCAWVKGLIW